MAKCKVLLVDDHALLRAGLKALIDSQNDLQVVGESGSVTQALQTSRALKPDVFILDISLPEGSGLQSIQDLRKTVPGARILVLTMHQDVAFLRSAIAAGANGYLTKRAASAEVLTALRQVFKGELFIDPCFPAGIQDEELSIRSSDREKGDDESPTLLSTREKEVLVLFAKGCTNAEIAKKLKIGVRSTETYKARIATKLGLKRRTDFVRYALEMGLIGSGDNPLK